MKHSVIEKPVGVDILKKAREIYQKRETALERYIDQVLIWNQKINIMSRNVSRETIREHIVHSLLPVPLGWIDLHSCWVDAGTGGGLPGIPLAIQTPGTRWILNDNVRKKIRVVEAIISECGLRNTGTVAQSIALHQLQPDCGIVSKHAFKIPDLLQKVRNSGWETILLWKGAEDIRKELKDAPYPVEAEIRSFQFGEEEPFYEGKALVKLTNPDA
ncbi:MAG: hypothetical protein DA446_01655 [Bacteroidetes bacterium]|nr:MAG: hypothetical protein DA443_00140 [Bacteroidota bacterium]PTM20761.1 MAG: hypothetical protein DA446_01655 [Bacteroidota bacterium]